MIKYFSYTHILAWPTLHIIGPKACPANEANDFMSPKPLVVSEEFTKEFAIQRADSQISHLFAFVQMYVLFFASILLTCLQSA